MCISSVGNSASRPYQEPPARCGAETLSHSRIGRPEICSPAREEVADAASMFPRTQRRDPFRTYLVQHFGRRRLAPPSAGHSLRRALSAVGSASLLRGSR